MSEDEIAHTIYRVFSPAGLEWRWGITSEHPEFISQAHQNLAIKSREAAKAIMDKIKA